MNTARPDASSSPEVSAWASVLSAPLRSAPRRQLRAGDSLFLEGDPSTDAWFVHRGLVKIVKTASGGGQAVVALLGTGGLVGAHAAIDGLPRGTAAIAATEVEVARLARREIVDAVRNGGAAVLDLLAHVIGQLRSTTRDVLALSTGESATLVAARLAELVANPMFASLRSTGPDGCVVLEMPISQHDLASWAGVSHRSCAGALHELRDAGIITTGRLHVDVHDPGALVRRAAGLS